MNITVVGAGYVGLTLAAVLASFKHKVWLVRKDRQKTEELKKGKIHFFEPDLEGLVRRGLENSRLLPTVDYREAVSDSEVIFICVGTPSLPDGRIDLSQVEEAAKEIGENLGAGYTVIVDKSTVLPGTAQKVKEIVKKYKQPRARFDICSCPEFLREGFTVWDTLHPERIIIGSENPKATRILKRLHRDFGAPIVITKIASAELLKYAANSCLALRIVFANQIADLCEKTEADINEVLAGIGLDKRIGSHYWYPGLGYGGSCFPKDAAALAAFAQDKGITDSLFERMHKLNKRRIGKIVKRLEEKFGPLAKRKIGVLGLACKQGTDDIRESPAIKIIQILERKRAKIKVYDPKALENAKRVLTKVEFFKDPYQAAMESEVLLLLTDWREFQALDYAKIKKLMKGNFIFDSRNILPKEKISALGFNYLGIGR